MVKKRNNVKAFIDILASRVSLLILGSITIWLGVSVAKETYRKHEARAELGRLKAEIIALERKNSNLSSLIDSFEDPGVIELEAKKRLNLKKPGEEVAVILRDKNGETQNIMKAEGEKSLSDLRPVTRLGEGSNDPSNPIKWWQYITSK